MTRNEIRRKVEVPLALPVIFAGIRTAAAGYLRRRAGGVHRRRWPRRLHHGRNCDDGAARSSLSARFQRHFSALGTDRLFGALHTR
jgi:hypothetical protein